MAKMQSNEIPIKSIQIKNLQHQKRIMKVNPAPTILISQAHVEDLSSDLKEESIDFDATFPALLSSPSRHMSVYMGRRMTADEMKMEEIKRIQQQISDKGLDSPKKEQKLNLSISIGSELDLSKQLDTSQFILGACSDVTIKIIELDEYEKVGGEWLCLKFINFLAEKNAEFWKKMTQPFSRSIYSLWSAAVLLGFIGINCWIMEGEFIEKWSANYILILILTLASFIYFVCVILEIYSCCKLQQISDNFFKVYAWIQFIFFSLSVYLTFALMINNVNYWYLFAAGIILTTFLQSLNIVMWIVMMPIIGICLFLECLLRFLSCNLECPQKKRKTKEYRYKLYGYSQSILQHCDHCAICLGEFTTSDCGLCILSCRVPHIFHESCLFEWVKKQDHCPICRGPINLKSD